MVKKQTVSKKVKSSRAATKAFKPVSLDVTVFSLSYIGVLCRTFIIACLLFVGYVSLMLHGSSMGGQNQFADTTYLFDTLQLIVLVTLLFTAYDALYVTIIKRYGIFPSLDRLALLTVEGVFILLLLLSWTLSMFSLSGSYHNNQYALFWFLVVTALLPSLRAFFGASLAVISRRTR